MADGTVPETVAVLVADRYQRDRVVNRMTESGVDAHAVDRDAPPAGSALVMTMHRAKGMEFTKVVLVDPVEPSPVERARVADLDPAERSDAELRRRSLRCVAATRARDELVVIRRGAASLR